MSVSTQSAEFSARRLTITVAHAPEVRRWEVERYLGADSKVRTYNGDKSRDEIVNAMSESVEESDEKILSGSSVVHENGQS